MCEVFVGQLGSVAEWFRGHFASTAEVSGHFRYHIVSCYTDVSFFALQSPYTGMDDRLRAGIPPWYVTKPTRSTQPCIPLGSLNRVPAIIGWGKAGNVTSAAGGR